MLQATTTKFNFCQYFSMFIWGQTANLKIANISGYTVYFQST